MKFTNYLKVTKYQSLCKKKKQMIWIALYLLKKSKLQFKTFSQRELQASIASLVNSTTHIKKNLYQLFQEIEKGLYILTNSFILCTSITLIQNQERLQTNIPHEEKCENTEKNFSKSNLAAYIKKILHHDQVGFIPRMQN